MQQTQVTPNVEGVFKNLECVGGDQCVCGGDIAAWYEGHDCIQGWLCADHLKYHVEVVLPYWVKLLREDCERLCCAYCRQLFDDVDAFARVWPLT